MPLNTPQQDNIYPGKDKQSVALVVGGGGLKPLGSASFFRLLDEYNLKPDIIICCSGGAILSSLWAQGFGYKALQDTVNAFRDYGQKNRILNGMDYKTLLSLGGYPGGRFNISSGILDSQLFMSFLKQINGDRRLEDNKIPTLFCTTELQTGKQFFINSGPIAESVYATCALYPMLPPIYLHEKWLVDGGYSSSVPVVEAVKRGFDKVIALVFEEDEPKYYKSFFQFYLHFVGRVFNKNARKRNSFAVHMHHDEILFVRFLYDRYVPFWNFDRLDYIQEVGEKTIQKKKDEILNIFKGK